MKFKNHFLLYIIAALGIMVCKKSMAQVLKPVKRIDTDVYIVGTVQAVNGISVAAYWKNGVAYKLSDSTLNCHGTAIAVSGNDVYVTGNYLITESGGITYIDPKAVYWKNGVETKLTANAVLSVACAIAVNNNNDVYVAGTIYDNKHDHAVYWKNGKVIELAPNVYTSNVCGLALNGADVYIAGNVNDTAAYWKNGLLTKLVDDDVPVIASITNAISLDGADIYIAGYSVSFDLGKNLIATYWANGEATHLTDGSSNAQVQAIVVKDNNIYAAGYVTNSEDNEVAAYWENGEVTNFADGVKIKGMALVGDDVYITGVNADQAVYWKNGVMRTLARGDASGIRIVTHPHN